jgi:hypothetical protein
MEESIQFYNPTALPQGKAASVRIDRECGLTPVTFRIFWGIENSLHLL